MVSSTPGRSSVVEIPTLWIPHRLRSLSTSSQFRELSLSAPKSQNPGISHHSSGLILRAMETGSLAVSPRWDGKEGPAEKHRGVLLAQGPFPRELHLFLGNLEQTGDTLGQGEGAGNPFQERGNLPGTSTDCVEGKDGFGEFQKDPLPVGKDLGMVIAFPYTGDFEVLRWPHQGKEVTADSSRWPS